MSTLISARHTKNGLLQFQFYKSILRSMSTQLSHHGHHYHHRGHHQQQQQQQQQLKKRTFSHSSIASEDVTPVPHNSSHKQPFVPAKPLTTKDLNPHTLEAKYAVRGKIPQRAEELRALLNSNTDHGLPFDEIVNANIGNPHQLKQQPITWYRQVLSLLQYPDAMHESNANLPSDVIKRAQQLLGDFGSMGAYSHSQGSPVVRQSIANFITRRDAGAQALASNIFLTNGALAAVLYLLQILSVDQRSGFLIPIPQYPLYTATITLNDAVAIGYYLDELNNWLTDPQQLRQVIREHQQQHVDIKALVVINPGNPTGSILSEHDIREIINIAAEHGIVLIADEVYQLNVYEGQFVSFKKVLLSMIRSHPELYLHVQLASLHSISKGFSGECGQRGGYMELVGFQQEVIDVILKLTSINLCSALSGQALMELMVNPPHANDESYKTYLKETQQIVDDLKLRAEVLHNAFENMEDVSCNKPQGAMYLFPRLLFTHELYPDLYARANSEGDSIDEVYCTELLEGTGICTVPGSGFGQKRHHYHLRTTFLAPGTDWIHRWEEFHKKFVKQYKKQ